MYRLNRHQFSKERTFTMADKYSEKMLNFTNYQGEKNSKSLHQSDYCQEGSVLMRMWRKRTLCTVGGNANYGCSHWRNTMESPQKNEKLEYCIIQQSYFLIYIQRKWRWSIEIHGLPCLSRSWCLLAQYSYQGFSEKEMKPETSQVAWLW